MRHRDGMSGAVTRRRGAFGVAVTAVVLVAMACVQPPSPTTTTTTESTTTTTEPTTTTTESTTTTTESTTTTTESTTTTTESTTTTTLPPQPQYFPMTASCRTTAVGISSDDTLGTGVTAFGPSTVPAGQSFSVQLTADPIEVPVTSGGYTIVNLNTVRIRFDVPANSTFVGATLSGGVNLGSGTPTVGLVNGQIRLDVPGPLAPGTTAVLPTVTATFQATGPVGTFVNTKLAGTSYSNPGITFVARVSGVPLFGTVNGNANCFVPNSPVLTSTQIL